MTTIIALTTLIFIMVWLVNWDERPWSSKDYSDMTDIVIKALFYLFVMLAALHYLIQNLP